MAYRDTKDEKYLKYFETVFDYTFKHVSFNNPNIFEILVSKNLRKICEKFQLCRGSISGPLTS